MNFQRLKSRLRRIHPDHHLIANDMAWVALLVLLGKLAGAAKEIAIAHRFGISAEVDAYLLVFNLVTWPVGVWFSVLTVVLVPLVARIRQSGEVQLPRFRSELFGIALVLGALLACIAWYGLPMLLSASWAGLPDAAASSAIDMVQVLALLAPLGVIIGLYSAWMLAAGRHANTLMESLPALTILVALVIFPVRGVEPLVWGTLVGFVFHLVALAVSLAKQGVIDAPRFTLQSPHWGPFRRGFGIMLVGQTMMSFTIIIDQFFAANLGTGAIATLGYANRILALILGIGAVAVGRATLPIFSKAQVNGVEHVRRVTAHWARLLLALGVVVTLASWWLAPLGVRLLFEHGKFTVHDTAQVTTVLRYGLMQIPFYFSGLVLVSLLASQGKYFEIAIVAIVGVAVKVGFNIVIIPHLGVSALMISSSLMYMTTTLLLAKGAFTTIKMTPSC